MSANRTFGESLKSLREAAGKKQQEVAKALGVSVAYVSDVERGCRLPFSPARIRALGPLLDAHVPSMLRLAAKERGFDLEELAGDLCSECRDRIAP